MPTTSQLGMAAGTTRWIVLSIAAAAWSIAALNEVSKPPLGADPPSTPFPTALPYSTMRRPYLIAAASASPPFVCATMGTMTLGIEATAAYRLTDEQELLRQTVRQLADERIAPRAAEIDTSGEFPWDVKELLAEHEILALPFPPVYGGVSGELLTLCLAVAEIAPVCVTSSLILAVQALAARAILPPPGGGGEERRRGPPHRAGGRRLAAFAVGGAVAGSAPAARRAPARREG